jgi:hypothetical protein
MLRKSLGVCFALMFALLTGFLSPAGAVGVGKTCAGVAGIPCDAGLWCDLDAGKCGGTDISGKCVRIPEVCNKAILPVCGCNKTTYNNDCERTKAMAQKDHDGRCH